MSPPKDRTTAVGLKNLSVLLIAAGILMLGAASLGWYSPLPGLYLFLTLLLISGGSVMYFSIIHLSYPADINNHGVMTRGLTARGWAGIMLFILLTAFYILYYWYNAPLKGLVRFLDPWSRLFRGKRSDIWFLYSTVYTFLVLILGYRAVLKYRHSRYHVLRTVSVVFFQLVFAYLMPYLLKYFQQPEKYMNYFWPLNYNDLIPTRIFKLWNHPGKLSIFILFWSASLTFIATPILTYFFGKRWYCSWVCGCGGLANTLGDPWRHLSDKSSRAWAIERISIYSVLAFVIISTGLLWADHFFQDALLGSISSRIYMIYGFTIGMVFAGVIGTGFYPIFGTRIWCRFGCPQAAILGILQRTFSRFRITTNGMQCVSCGNCSAYCEMGIDVKAYATRGKNIIRASCVGCGICAAVCPRGVLKLENGPRKSRYNKKPDLLAALKAG